MSLPSFGAEVSIYESAAGLATTGLRRPQLSLIDPQRKLLIKYFWDSAQLLGLLLLFLLLLCSVVAVVFSVESAINLVLRPTLHTNLSQHLIP